MIWRAVRHMLATEILTWFAFLAIGGALSAIAVDFLSANTVSVALAVLWCGLFVAIYRLRYKHL